MLPSGIERDGAEHPLLDAGAVGPHLAGVGPFDVHALLALEGSGGEEVQVDAERLVADLQGDVLVFAQGVADPLALDQRGRVVLDLLDPHQAFPGPTQGGHERMLIRIARPQLGRAIFGVEVSVRSATR